MNASARVIQRVPVEFGRRTHAAIPHRTALDRVHQRLEKKRHAPEGIVRFAEKSARADVWERIKDRAILGSGSLVSQLTRQGLIDEYQFMVNPVALGKGRTLLEDLQGRLVLRLISTRAFSNGNVLLFYEPVR